MKLTRRAVGALTVAGITGLAGCSGSTSFTAEYAGGEIEVEADEIADAGWFSATELPRIPGRISVARALIDWFLDQQ